MAMAKGSRTGQMLVLAAVLAAVVCGWRAQAAEAQNGPRTFRSRNFIIHTDLSEEDAQDQLKRLETMLALISKYWGRPSRRAIECYVAEDLKNWPAGSLPPDGYAKIAEGAGITITQQITDGKRFDAKSLVFATSEGGVSQHEAVHAYCQQTFGRTGPVWYAEGMAEMGQYWVAGEKAVNADPYVIKYLREAEPKSLAAVVSTAEFTGDSWQNYAWRWALCHLLANNPNYAKRFRPLGLGILTGQPVSFKHTYGPMAKEISFEYLFFLSHVNVGYRVDLCSWDWKRKFRKLTPESSALVSCRLVANRGWQPSGLELLAGIEYEFEADGKWKTSKDGDQVEAGGDDKSYGLLVGTIMQDFELSEPFALGKQGSFKAPSDGKLYLRCQDQWHELADNSGRMTVRLKVKKD